ncbi:hypothetical protein Ddye_003132 [Dipteronia dyeriana]|uniref:Uncharacterized protein n=1 Tax=Dipteronia dyeriana TaxID=168575 RepID=A0AAE0CVP5_9ROSI|nr:hypothetical protein Ddye_003132 [Dipteronia dyeriana]
MIPVLDYLGKLGVRKSTVTEFLRRYPQILHASVVVDLAPVVKYHQGLDIKLSDIPLVLERYPKVLRFKLEGTMSTSVAYLVGIGVATGKERNWGIFNWLPRDIRDASGPSGQTFCGVSRKLGYSKICYS